MYATGRGIVYAEQAGVQWLYVKCVRVDRVEINGAPNLTAVHLGHERIEVDVSECD